MATSLRFFSPSQYPPTLPLRLVHPWRKDRNYTFLPMAEWWPGPYILSLALEPGTQPGNFTSTRACLVGVGAQRRVCASELH
jgi:hypothetical protein